MPHLFDPKASREMFEIAENFVPEYAIVLNAIVGATFIASNCDIEETTKMANYLLQHDSKNKFPVIPEYKVFLRDHWLNKKYSRILKLHYTVDTK